MDIPETMKCVRCHAPGDYRVEEVGVPEVGEGELLVKVLAVGICAGDAKCFAGAPYYWGNSDRACYIQPPVIPGHEFAGEVVRLGEGSAEKYGLAVGDHAIAEQIVPCWDCHYCKNGHYNLCIPHDVFGWRQKTQGGMAVYMKYPKGSIVHKIPPSIPGWQTPFIEPLACSVHAVNLGEIQRGDVVVVSGCGPLGLGMVAAAKLKSPKTLIALDLYDWKLEVAKSCGADLVFNPRQCNVVKEVVSLTEGRGCDIYIESTGHGESVRQGLTMVRPRGRLVEYGVFGGDVSLDWSLSSRKGEVECNMSTNYTMSYYTEITIVGGHLGPGCYPQAISMLESGALPIEKVITHQLDMTDVVEGIKMVTDSSKSIKIILLPNF
ncbi:erythritol/L-threitol dehydrogenase-like isoform X2 [Halichondria panicea]